MTDFTLNQILLRFCALLVIVAVHGAAVAGAAYILGDAGPRYDGRLRVNPLTHIDLLGFASGVLFSVGWTKPVAIDPGTLRMGRCGLAVIVVVASAAVLVILLALQLLRPVLLPYLADTPSTLVFALIDAIGQLGIWFALINLLPLPPLTGSHLVVALVPSTRGVIRRLHIYAAVLLTALAATGLITRALAPAYGLVAHIVLGE